LLYEYNFSKSDTSQWPLASVYCVILQKKYVELCEEIGVCKPSGDENSSALYIKTLFGPHREHIVIPLESKQSQFCVNIMQNA
jgi:hypothetical protein